jgi:pilus assembly protein CpaF
VSYVHARVSFVRQGESPSAGRHPLVPLVVRCWLPRECSEETDGPRSASPARVRHRMSADPLADVRRQLRAQLRERVDARGLSAAPRTERRVRVREEALTLMRESGALLPQRDLARVVNEVSDEVVGFGPIEFLLKDPDVTEVMVNGPDDVYVEREGRIERVEDRLFEGEESVLHLIERIVGPLGLRVDQASPWVDARLPGGSRVHAAPLPAKTE